MQHLSELKDLLGKPQKVIITTHQHPDADALGSSLALAAFLQKKGHVVHVITPTDYPSFLNWMPGQEDVIIYKSNKKKEIGELVDQATLIFCLDFSSLARIDELGEMVRVASAKKVLIDHHQNPEDFADYMFWSTEAAATAEILFEVMVGLGDGDLIDKNIAECIYAGINTDTGSFKHPNTTQNVHRIAAELIGKGADVAKVSSQIYDSNSLDRLKFIGFALSKRLKVIRKYQTAYFVISMDDLRYFKSKTGDTEGLVNYALSLKDIVLACIIIDRGKEIKLSFRSVGNFAVNEMAKEHFGGGGHKNAAGGISLASLKETEEQFVNLLPQYEEKIKSAL